MVHWILSACGSDNNAVQKAALPNQLPCWQLARTCLYFSTWDACQCQKCSDYLWHFDKCDLSLHWLQIECLVYFSDFDCSDDNDIQCYFLLVLKRIIGRVPQDFCVRIHPPSSCHQLLEQAVFSQNDNRPSDIRLPALPWHFLNHLFTSVRPYGISRSPCKGKFSLTVLFIGRKINFFQVDCGFPSTGTVTITWH